MKTQKIHQKYIRTLLCFRQLPLSFIFLLSLPSASLANPIDVSDIEQVLVKRDDSSIEIESLSLQAQDSLKLSAFDNDSLRQFTLYDPVDLTSLVNEPPSLSSYILEQEFVETQAGHLVQNALSESEEISLEEESSDQSKEDSATDEAIPASYVTGSFTLATDYLFRGLSQTNQTLAVQGGLQYNYDPMEKLNLYTGIWSSNVDFGPSAEIDFYVGTNYAVNDQLSLGFGTYFYHYTSFQARPTADFWEFIPNFTYDFGAFAFTGSAAYSPKYSFGAGESLALESAFNVPIDDSFYAAATFGYAWFERNAQVAIPDYAYWRFGIGYVIDNYDIFLQFSDTGIARSECIPPGSDSCDPAIVLSVTYSW